ncbi:MAG: hypothetical protein NVS3B20_10970 [Polyangiales bacterium]
MKNSDRFRDEELDRAFDLAMKGDRAPLFDRLRRASGLPSPRVNEGLISAFAGEAARRGAAADFLLEAMIAMEEDVAPYGHVDEIFPILGVAGVGARAVADEGVRTEFLEVLEEASCDRRSRVRDEVGRALIRLGVVVGPPFVKVLLRWIESDQTYLARAVASTLSDGEFLGAIGSEGAAALLDACCKRIAVEHRAGRRHDAYRKFCRVLTEAPPKMVARHPLVSEVLVKQAANPDEDVRAVIEASVEPIRRGRATDRAQLIADALAKSKKPSRDPRWDRLPGRRGRGKKA